jgi:hypothetical protein
MKPSLGKRFSLAARTRSTLLVEKSQWAIGEYTEIKKRKFAISYLAREA